MEGPLTRDADDLILAARDDVGLAMVDEADAGSGLAAGVLRRVVEDSSPPLLGS